MSDKQQIEELRKFISQLCCNSNCDNCKWRHMEEGSCSDHFVAEAIYNANYRKVPENAIVLTNEKLELGEWKGEVEVMNMARQTYDACLKQARKETAKEFADKLKAYIDNNKHQSHFFGTMCLIDKETVNEIAKQFGVEVEE